MRGGPVLFVIESVMEFGPLVCFGVDGKTGWVAGAEHHTRDDGSSSLMIAQVYSAPEDLPEGSLLVDDVGTRWCTTHPLRKGIHFTGIILEEERFHVGSSE
jgi:hypothetical protein